MSTLLATLGSSPMILPEAILVYPQRFRSVHVFTSDSEKTDTQILEPFFAEQTDTEFTVTRLIGFRDLRSQEEHDHYEEGLFRWYLQHLTSANAGLPYVCLAGGFKSMVAGIQRAAQLFGSAGVFHVLADFPNGKQPQTLAEVSQADADGKLRCIDLGAEPGWPSLRSLAADNSYSLPVVKSEGIVRWVECGDSALVHQVRSVQEQTRRKATGWDALGELPFPSLALRSPGFLEWLQTPIDTSADASWIRRLPKIELHTHLGGFATHGDLLEDVRSAAHYPEQLPKLMMPEYPEGWPLPRKPIGLEAYRHLGDATGSTLLSDPGCLERHCERLYRELLADRVIYAEIRCSPANYTHQGLRAIEALNLIQQVFEREMNKARKVDPDGWCKVNLIVIATRKSGGDLSDIARHLSLAVTAFEESAAEERCSVVGVDLAGYEAPETRPHYFQSNFEAAHRCGLAVTVHAGENDDAESIWQAVHKLFARRLGHALRLGDAPDLMRTVADRQIAVEMCPYANVQIVDHAYGIADGNSEVSYPLLSYLRKGVRVTVNTDNLGISGANLSDNCLLAARLCKGLTPKDLIQLQKNALDAAFIPAEQRPEMLARYETCLRLCE